MYSMQSRVHTMRPLSPASFLRRCPYLYCILPSSPVMRPLSPASPLRRCPYLYCILPSSPVMPMLDRPIAILDTVFRFGRSIATLETVARLGRSVASSSRVEGSGSLEVVARSND